MTKTLAIIAVLLCFPASLSAQAPRLTVLTYNIHHGEGTDGKVDLQRLAEVIRRCDPDLVALQEVDHKTNRTGHVDQTAELARLTKMHGYFFKQIDYDGGQYGQAILSKTKARELAQHVLPGEPERERRLLGRARFEIDGQMLWFATTHLHHADPEIRLEQVNKINTLFAHTPTSELPFILTGDFNALLESREMEVISRVWKISGEGENLPTFPARQPKRQIDYIVVRPSARFRVMSAKSLVEPVPSDHTPLLVELELIP